jgi:hypothetical protein
MLMHTTVKCFEFFSRVQQLHISYSAPQMQCAVQSNSVTYGCNLRPSTNAAVPLRAAAELTTAAAALVALLA